MDLTGATAYHGPGWRPRLGTLVDDVADGVLWAPYAVASDSAVLRAVALHCPTRQHLEHASPDVLQHAMLVEHAGLEREINMLAGRYEALGVRVHWVPPPPPELWPKRLAGANAMYARDLLWMTPAGAVISRMASTVRAGEERQAQRLLAELGVPTVRTIAESGTFEGADALWLRPGLAAIGHGRRTNAAGADQAARVVHELGGTVVDVKVPDTIQHLLGLVQVLDEDLLAVRVDLVRPRDLASLKAQSFELIEVHESLEIARHLAFNFVVLGPRRVLMMAGAVELSTQLTSHGIDVVDMIRADHLLDGAGGIACATGVLWRAALADRNES